MAIATPRADKSSGLLTTAACLALAVCGSSFTTVSARASTGSHKQPGFATTVESNNKDYLVFGHLGGPATRIYSTDVPNGLGPVSVSWSGEHVAFAFADDSGHENIGVIDADGSNFRQLTHIRLGYFEHIVWSPDDRTIFFDGTTHPTEGSKTGVARVRQVPADGSSAPTTIDGSHYAVPTSARPDGRWLALNSDKPEPGYGRCAVMHVNGTNKHNVGPANCNDALWRPGRRQLAITRVTADSYYDGPTVQIWLLSLKTHRYHVIPNIQKASGGGTAYPLAWSSDGAVLYYERRTQQGAFHLYRIRLDGTGKRDITPTVSGKGRGAFAIQPG